MTTEERFERIRFYSYHVLGLIGAVFTLVLLVSLGRVTYDWAFPRHGATPECIEGSALVAPGQAAINCNPGQFVVTRTVGLNSEVRCLCHAPPVSAP